MSLAKKEEIKKEIDDLIDEILAEDMAPSCDKSVNAKKSDRKIFLADTPSDDIFNDNLDEVINQQINKIKPIKSTRVLKLKEGGEKKEKKKALSSFFYKVSNHHELFKIGNSFFEDFKRGVKSFAVSSTGYQASQQRTILGLASFLDHQSDLRIGIISDNLYLGVFKELIVACNASEIQLKTCKTALEAHSFFSHFDFIDMNHLIETGSRAGTDYEEYLDEVVDHFDVVFWDVPELYKIQLEKEIYFPIIMRFDSLSIIVAKSATSQNEVEEIRAFFLGYGINLKGLLIDPQSENKKNDTSKIKGRPWWKGGKK